MNIFAIYATTERVKMNNIEKNKKYAKNI